MMESLRCLTVQRDLSRAIRKREKSKSDGSSAYLYDAFLSFNESDHDLVYDHLAPHLEDRHGTGSSLNLFDDLTESCATPCISKLLIT